MGKCNQGVFGNWTKRVGNVVGRVVNGRNIYSIYQPNVSNPQTETQKQTRTKFSLLTKLGSVIGGFLAIGLMKNKGDGTWLSRFISINFKNGVTGTWPSYELNFPKLILSQGNVDLPYNTAAQLQGSDVNITWTDNSGIGNAKDSDKAMFLIYNKDKNASIADDGAADRSTRQVSYSLPASWNGDTVYVYFAMKRVDRGEAERTVSASMFLGQFTVGA